MHWFYVLCLHWQWGDWNSQVALFLWNICLPIFLFQCPLASNRCNRMVLNFCKCSHYLRWRKTRLSSHTNYLESFVAGGKRLFPLKVASVFLSCSRQVFRTLICHGSQKPVLVVGVRRGDLQLWIWGSEKAGWISHKTLYIFKFKEKVRNQELKLKWRVLKKD